MHQIKKFYTFLFIAIVIAASSFIWQLIQANKITVKQVDTPLVSDGYYEIKIEDDDINIGNPGAPLTVVIFNDYLNSDSQKNYTEISTFVKNHPQDVRMFIKNYSVGSVFLKANDLPARAVFCAGKQDKFWKFSDAVIDSKNKSTQNDLEQIASVLNLDTAKWSDCLVSDETTQKIKRVVDMAQTLAITKLPAIYVNNKKITLEKDLSITDLLTKFTVK